MKRKSPLPVRRLPVHFEADSQFAISHFRFINHGRLPNASPSPGGEGAGEGELNNRGHQSALTHSKLKTQNSSFSRRGFTLVEILVVMVLLSLIVFALMAVFSGIQRAFRASLTQTDTLEGGRAVMDLIANDLEGMTPCDAESNLNYYPTPTGQGPAPVNFYVNTPLQPFIFPPSPLLQPLISSPTGQERTNILENIFILSKGSFNGVPSWIGTGYSVTTNLSDGTLYPLYRFYMVTNASAGPTAEAALFSQFDSFQYANSNIWSHLMDGVVNLTARAYDTNGVWMTNGYANPLAFHVKFARFQPLLNSLESYCAFYSNAVPASVQIELGTFEDHTLAHAESLTGAAQTNYLSNAAGQVHLFSRRVWIRNLDPTAYQQ